MKINEFFIGKGAMILESYTPTIEAAIDHVARRYPFTMKFRKEKWHSKFYEWHRIADKLGLRHNHDLSQYDDIHSHGDAWYLYENPSLGWAAVAEFGKSNQLVIGARSQGQLDSFVRVLKDNGVLPDPEGHAARQAEIAAERKAKLDNKGVGIGTKLKGDTWTGEIVGYGKTGKVDIEITGGQYSKQKWMSGKGYYIVTGRPGDVVREAPGNIRPKMIVK